jgi:nitroimidazol reductase NimA-like FMN-containing flavoprotein (pyridoxamine 5'-phosphate oxidase superfamily)
MSNDSNNISKYHVKRHDDREVFDRDAVNALLDSEYVAHVGFVDSDINEPFVIPMAYARDKDRILLHGSTGSRLMMQLAKGAQMCVTVTKLNALIVAKSAFNSSMNYESVMIFGVGKRLEDSEKLEAMDRVTDALIPGMVGYARPTTAKEAAAFFYIRVIVLMFFKDPVEDGASVVIPSALTTTTIAVSATATLVLGLFPAPLINYIATTAAFLR